MAFRKWIDIDRWTEIDLEYLVSQSEALSNDLNRDAVKDAIMTIKNSLNFLEKQKCTKEERDRMTKERINILLRQGFEIRLKEKSSVTAVEPGITNHPSESLSSDPA